MNFLKTIILMALFLMPFAGAFSVESGTIFNATGSGSAVSFDVDAELTRATVGETFVYLEGLSYSSGGTSYSCDYNHSGTNTLVSVSALCVSSTTVTISSSGSSSRVSYKPGVNSFSNGYKVNVVKGQGVEVPVGDKGFKKNVEVKKVDKNSVTVSVENKDYDVILDGETKIDLDSDGIYDVKIYNSKIYNGIATLEFNLISEEVPSEEQEGEKGNVSEGIVGKIPEAVKKIGWKFYAAVVIVFLLAFMYFALFGKNKKRKHK